MLKLKTVILIAIVVVLFAGCTLGMQESGNSNAPDKNKINTDKATLICGKHDVVSVLDGEYKVQNLVLEADTAQCILVDGTGFTVVTSDYYQDTIAAFPSIYKGDFLHNNTVNSGMPILVNEIEKFDMSLCVSTDGVSGVWDVITDSWFSPYYYDGDVFSGGAELVIWIDDNGMEPRGAQVGTAFICGAIWEVWYADVDYNYIAYRRTGLSSISLDINEFIKDSVTRGYIKSSWYLHDILAGFEIKQGGAGLITNSFSANVTSINNSSSSSSSSSSSDSDIIYLSSCDKNKTWTISNSVTYNIQNESEGIIQKMKPWQSDIMVSINGSDYQPTSHDWGGMFEVPANSEVLFKVNVSSSLDIQLNWW